MLEINYWFFAVMAERLTAARIIVTSAGRCGSAQSSYNYAIGAADAGINSQRLIRAIFGAGAAFHAAIAVDYRRLFVLERKNRMGTDNNTHRAAGTKGLIQFQRSDIF